MIKTLYSNDAAVRGADSEKDAVYIVVKESEPIKTAEGLYIPFRTNEAVFKKEEDAQRYIISRIRLNDRDDWGCRFEIEPWHVEKI